jgi:hypothetical protein
MCKHCQPAAARDHAFRHHRDPIYDLGKLCVRLDDIKIPSIFNCGEFYNPIDALW